VKRVTRISSLGILIILVAVVLSACGQAGEGTGSYDDITPAQLKGMLDNKDFLFVNVHIPYEAEIPQTDIFVPYNEIEQNLSEFPDNREAKIVLYCRSGSMSATAARALVDLGFTNVWNLEGGFVGWEAQGYELIRNGRTTGQPRIYFEEDSFDAGMVPWGDSLEYTFQFTNVGDAPLTIGDVSVLALEGC